MTKEEKQEQRIIEKFEAQRNSVRPSRELLSKIIAQLPAQAQNRGVFDTRGSSLALWIRLAIPAGVLALVGGIFFAATQLPPGTHQAPTPVASPEHTAQHTIPPVSKEKALSLASLNTEEQQIEEDFLFEEFFQDELQMQEVDTALADF